MQALSSDRLAEASADHTFGAFVRHAQAVGQLVVQPRMGFDSTPDMRRGLLAVRGSAPHSVGTITVDSFTRVRDYAAVDRARHTGQRLNGYPLVTIPPATTRHMLAGLRSPAFPVQIRHGAAMPFDIVRAGLAAGLTVSEGGPVSYCLPYSRVPLRTSAREWARSCELLAHASEQLLSDSGQYDEFAAGLAMQPHLESFGGCMLGQLCPPELLIALSMLEGLFFCQHGLRSVSLSYAQQTNHTQDVEALHALGRLATRYLPSGTDWHVVLYTYMGVFPESTRGASKLNAAAARLAVDGGAQRLIVKTPAEAQRIPTIDENTAALRAAADTARHHRRTTSPSPVIDTGIEDRAIALIEATLELSPRLVESIPTAFNRGYLDVPYCLHADNRNATRSRVAADGRLIWAETGALPLPAPSRASRLPAPLTSRELLGDLSFVRRRYDC